MYSLPNIVLPLFVGVLIDRLGLGKCTIITSVLAMIGQAVFSVGAGALSFNLALLGRFIFGLGNEILLCIQFIYVTRWFSDSELNFAMGVSGGVASLGMYVSGWCVPHLASSWGMDYALGLGALLCLGSVVSNLFMVRRDKVAF